VALQISCVERRRLLKRLRFYLSGVRMLRACHLLRRILLVILGRVPLVILAVMVYELVLFM
jgi:hypothetical protein